jgi:SM-20-related protein
MTPDELSALRESGWFQREHYAGADEARRARKIVDGLPLREAGVGRERAQAPSVRGDRIAWLDGPGEIQDRFERLREELNRDAWLGLERFDVQVARYEDGAAYASHRDAFRGGPSRRVTAIWYLNDAWIPAHGGVLRLHLDGGVLDVPPTLDRLVVFLSEKIEHEVLPVAAPRLALTAWYYGPSPI